MKTSNFSSSSPSNSPPPPISTLPLPPGLHAKPPSKPLQPLSRPRPRKWAPYIEDARKAILLSCEPWALFLLPKRPLYSTIYSNMLFWLWGANQWPRSLISHDLHLISLGARHTRHGPPPPHRRQIFKRIISQAHAGPETARRTGSDLRGYHVFAKGGGSLSYGFRVLDTRVSDRWKQGFLTEYWKEQEEMIGKALGTIRDTLISWGRIGAMPPAVQELGYLGLCGGWGCLSLAITHFATGIKKC